MPNEERCAQNTDREIYREPDTTGHGAFYSDSIHVTENGGISINCSGRVIVLPLREWHARAIAALPVQVSGEAKLVDLSALEDADIREILRRYPAATAMLAASPPAPAPASQVLTEEDQLIVQTAKRNICGISTAPLDTRHLLVETVAILDRLTNKDAEHG